MLLETMELYAMGVLKPARVVISGEPFNAVRLRKAQRKGIGYDTIFIRNDGWTIGCCAQWRGATFKIYRGDWIAVATLFNQQVRRFRTPKNWRER